jgi:hypothetical protein
MMLTDAQLIGRVINPHDDTWMNGSLRRFQHGVNLHKTADRWLITADVAEPAHPRHEKIVSVHKSQDEGFTA